MENSLPTSASKISSNTRCLCARHTVLIGALLACLGAQANTDAEFDEIQVTATRKAVSSKSISTGVTVVRADEIALSSLVTDALSHQLGAFVQETTPGQGAVIIRGMKGSEILHLVDGVRLNNAIFRNAPTQYVALVDPRTIARVEVARGAASSLYGSDAMGGAVNLITRKPALSESSSDLRGDVHLSAASADLSRSASIGIEASGKRFAGLARVSTFDAGNRRAGDSDRTPYSAYAYNAARLAMVAAPNARHSFLVDLQYLQQPATNRVDELIPGYGQTEPGSSEFSFEPNERIFAHLSYDIRQGLLSADWKTDIAWQRIVDDRIIRGYESDRRNIENNSSDLFTLNISGVREFDNRSIVFGIDFQHDTVSSARETIDIASGISTSVAPRFPDQSTVEFGAIYANLRQGLGNRSEITFGGRLGAARTEAPETPVSTAVSINETNLTGDIGWIYHVNDEWSFVANAGRGFRQPNIFDLGTFGERPGNRFNIPNGDLRAETVISLDAGFRHSNTAWSSEMRLYTLRYENKIESVPTGDITADGRQVVQGQNLSSVDVFGVEFKSEVALADDLMLGTIINYSRGEAILPGQSGTPADRIPPLFGQLDFDWYFREHWQLRPYFLFTASQERLSPRDVSDPRIDPTGTAGWATVNISLAYSPDTKIRLVIAAQNLLDKNYRVHGSGIDARGRNLSANISLRW